MSVHRKHLVPISSARGGLARPSAGTYSSFSLGSYPRASTAPRARPGSSALGVPIRAVSVNKSLLTPVNVQVDPTAQAVRTQEKEQIKTLNNRFASFIDKVRILEQENTMLETQWKLLQTQTKADSKLDPMMQHYIRSLKSQLDAADRDKKLLEAELSEAHRRVEESKQRYEDEINKRNTAENEFVLLKKDVDSGYLSKSSLEDQMAAVLDDLKFLKSFYDQELLELKEDLKSTSVVVEMDNSRQLNMEQIVSDVKHQYEDISKRSRQETEEWYKNKFELASSKSEQYKTELQGAKTQIADLKRAIMRLKNEMTSIKGQCDVVDGQVCEAEDRGQRSVKDAQHQIDELEAALQTAKKDMAKQVRDYQELMNLKLALDIEIATYKRLLEGEEKRLNQDSVISVQTVPKQSLKIQKPAPGHKVLIKMVQTQDEVISKGQLQ
ncbi:keratin, type II cytoskeletal 8 [Chanos chanos]|uniref:Keratin, type II cytoskeletal 8 n=1 Tax=Chanos chanos TaxID=29144 RepID=A0A6J2W6G9_CHACN|nr:keratin, type II cytoskeletal 8-like [Chanos chanos]